MVAERLLTAFFLALAISISATQILQTVLVLLIVPWKRAAHGRPPWRRIQALAATTWADTASLRRHPLTGPLVLLTVLTLLSAAFSDNPGWSLWIARDVLRITVFYLVLWHTRDTTHASRLWQGFLLMLTAMAGYGVIQASLCRARPTSLPDVWLAHVCTHPTRIRGPFSIYMTFGDVLMLGALLCLAHLANEVWRRVGWMGPAWGPRSPSPMRGMPGSASPWGPRPSRPPPGGSPASAWRSSSWWSWAPP
jgi:hypothetical protein